MTATENRTRNAQALAERIGGPAPFAAKVGKAYAYCYNILHGKPIGHKAARDIEQAFGVPTGWLDVAHSQEEQPDELPYRATIRAAGAEFRVSASAARVARVYDQLGQLQRDMIDQMLDAWLLNLKKTNNNQEPTENVKPRRSRSRAVPTPESD